MGMRGSGGGGGGGGGGGMDMKGGNFRGSGDNWSGNSGGMHCIHMRGLPFRATEQDIADVRLQARIIKIF